MRTEDRVIRDLLCRRDEYLRSDTEFPVLRGNRARVGTGASNFGANSRVEAEVRPGES